MGMPFWGRIDLSLSGCHCAMMSQVLFSPGPDGWVGVMWYLVSVALLVHM